MTTDAYDAARDEFYDQISRELYAEHKERAIEEHTSERLRSYYVDHPTVMRPAVEAILECKTLLNGKRYAPALVFAASAFELLLKATVLRPVVFGLVHHEVFAELIVDRTLGKQTDISRYEPLLGPLFTVLAGVDLKTLHREGAHIPLLSEAKELQSVRDRILHQGARCTEAEARRAFHVACAIYDQIVVPMIAALQLKVGEKGVISRA